MTITTHRLFLLSKCLLVAACGSGGGTDSSPVSSAGGSSSSSVAASNTSHYAGEDCMDCHNDTDDNGAETFTVAGTIYKSSGVQTNATIRLYVPDTNTLRAELETDNSGNFYTTEHVEGLFTGGELVEGLNVEVEGPSGNRHNMPGIITAGNCNGCHHNNGGGNGRIVVN